MLRDSRTAKNIINRPKSGLVVSLHSGHLSRAIHGDWITDSAPGVIWSVGASRFEIVSDKVYIRRSRDDEPQSHMGTTYRLEPKRAFDSSETQDLRQRLENANAYFRWKAAEVFEDESAVRLLAKLYESVIIEFSDFDSCEDGVSLAKLTAAAFCEFSSTGIYITESGQRFIESINNA